MKKCLLAALSLLITAVFSGCVSIGEKATSFSFIYGAVTVLSLLLLIGCCVMVRKKKSWFILLFSSVLVVNTGYTILSVSTCLNMALWANRIAYLGSVFLPLSMLMIILNVTNTNHAKWLDGALVVLSLVMFSIAASPGVLPIYYKEVSFAVINGVSTLVKVYGPLHPLYLVFLLGYFSAMVTVIVRASVKKTIATASHAVILAIAVFANIGVWFVEQISDIAFEMLSVSYIISELFLLGAHLVMNENQRLRELVRQKEKALQAAHTPPQNSVSEIEVDCFMRGLEVLTPTEKTIYEAYLLGKSTKDIMRELNIKENTLKFHNKNLYSKLGVYSRKRLLEVQRAITAKDSAP